MAEWMSLFSCYNCSLVLSRVMATVWALNKCALAHIGWPSGNLFVAQWHEIYPWRIQSLANPVLGTWMFLSDRLLVLQKWKGRGKCNFAITKIALSFFSLVQRVKSFLFEFVGQSITSSRKKYCFRFGGDKRKNSSILAFSKPFWIKKSEYFVNSHEKIHTTK